MAWDNEADVTALAQAMGVPPQMALLQQRMKRAQGLIDVNTPVGREVGHTYVASSPVEHLAAAMTRIVGNQRANAAEQAMQPLIQQQQAGNLAQARIANLEHQPAPKEWGAPLGMTRGEAGKAGILKNSYDEQKAPDAMLYALGDQGHPASLLDTLNRRDATTLYQLGVRNENSKEQAAIKAGTPHGRAWAEVNWTNPVTGAQDRHLLNMLDGSRWSLDGKTMLSPPPKGWATPPGAAEPAGHAGHGAAPSVPPAPPAPAPTVGDPAAPPVAVEPPAPKPARLGAPKPAGYSNTPAGVQAKAIADGAQPPDLAGVKYRDGVRVELAKNGYDLTTATTDWKATQRYVATMNGPQQTRLRQTLDAMPHQLDNIESLYRDWQRVGSTSGFKVFNRASLALAKQRGGEIGAIATNLEAQINDVSAELANVYMGGNSPTDHALKLAETNLKGEWDDATFKKAMELTRRNLVIRRNSVTHSAVGGASENNRYAPQASGTEAPASGGASDLRSKYGL